MSPGQKGSVLQKGRFSVTSVDVNLEVFQPDALYHRCYLFYLHQLCLGILMLDVLHDYESTELEIMNKVDIDLKMPGCYVTNLFRLICLRLLGSTAKLMCFITS